MELFLERKTLTENSTIGELAIDGHVECYTLELPVKDGKPGSAIPDGRYPVVLDPSPRFMAADDLWVSAFAAQMPHIIQIPDRSLIMFHWGNKAEDTDGCVLVGQTFGVDFIGNSRAAFEDLMERIVPAARANDCFVTVTTPKV